MMISPKKKLYRVKLPWRTDYQIYNENYGIKIMRNPCAFLGMLVLAMALLMTIAATPVFAAMNELSDEQLHEVTGAGFSSFTLTEGPTETVARAYFNILARTYTEIDSLKMGYYDDGATLGWDQDWTNVSFGTPDTDLVVRGFYIEASFSNITDPANRTLNSVKVGTSSMTGTISAEFNSFSGLIRDTGGVDLVNAHRVNLGSATITCNGSAFSASLNMNGTEKGWWMYFDNAGITYH